MLGTSPKQSTPTGKTMTPSQVGTEGSGSRATTNREERKAAAEKRRKEAEEREAARQAAYQEKLRKEKEKRDAKKQQEKQAQQQPQQQQRQQQGVEGEQQEAGGRKKKNSRARDDAGDDVAGQGKRQDDKLSPMKAERPQRRRSRSRDRSVASLDTNLTIGSGGGLSVRSTPATPTNKQRGRQQSKTATTGRSRSGSILRNKGEKGSKYGGNKGSAAQKKQQGVDRKSPPEAAAAAATPNSSGTIPKSAASSKGGGVRWGASSTKEIPNRGGATVGNKRTKPDELKKPEGPPNYVSTGFVKTVFYMPPGLKADLVPVEWKNAMHCSLCKFHEKDASVCLVDPNNDGILSGGKRIYGRVDFPEHWIDWKQFAAHENPNLFNIPTLPDKERRIESTIKMGFKCPHGEIDTFLKEYLTDLKMTKGLRGVQVNFQYKPFQAFDCSRMLTLLNGPTKCTPASYQRGVEQLAELERELVQKNPDNWSPFVHRGPFPKMHPFLDWGKGGNFKKGVEGEDTTFRKTMQFLYEKKDEARIHKVVTECKRLELEKKVFGQHAHWQIIEESPDDGQRAEMDNMIFNHGAIQKSMGNAILHGLRNPDYKVQVELEPIAFDEDGNGIPRPSPGSHSVRDLLCNIWMDGEMVIQSILRGYDGSMRAFFLNGEFLEEMALNIAFDPASFIKVYLLKRGWALPCIAKLIRKSFTVEAASAASQAQWDKKLKRVISGREMLRDERNRTLFSGSVNREAGLTPSERKAEEKASREAKARELGGNLADLPEGDFGAFIFSDDISMKTISKGKHVRPPPSGLSQKSEYQAEAKSTHTFGAGGVPTFENLEGSDDDSMAEADGPRMAFNLDDMETDEQGGTTANEEGKMAEEEEVEDGDEEDEEVDKSWDMDSLRQNMGDEVSLGQESRESSLGPSNLNESQFQRAEGEGETGGGEGGGEDLGEDTASQVSNLDAFQESFAGAGGTYEERKAMLEAMLANLNAEQNSQAPVKEQADAAATDTRADVEPEGAPAGDTTGGNGGASHAEEVTAGQSTHTFTSTSRTSPEEQAQHEKPPASAGGKTHPPGEGDDASDPG